MLIFKRGYGKISNGTVLPHQKRPDGWLVEVDTLPSFGAKTLSFEPQEAAREMKSNFIYHDRKLETPFYLVEWNEFGQMTTIYDKEAERHVLAENERGNVLQIFEDKPLAHDAWDIDIFYQEKMEEIRDISLI